MSILKENDPWTWGGGWAQGSGQDMQGQSSPWGGAPSPLSPPSPLHRPPSFLGFPGGSGAGRHIGRAWGQEAGSPASL